MKHDIPDSHPRKQSLLMRERLIAGWENKVTATAGLFAHGRGEAFDYILGEQTIPPAIEAIRAAAATLLLAQKPVISVNGNVAALDPGGCVALSKSSRAALEVNLFYRSHDREKAIAAALKKAGATEVLGLGKDADSIVPGLDSERAKVDSRGIFAADVVFLALEDGDRTEQLAKMGKKIIAVDLNPFSRTAQFAQITIVDNIVRVLGLLDKTVQEFASFSKTDLHKIVKKYDNSRVLGSAIKTIRKRLESLEKKGLFMEVPGL
ncbi:MAG: phosphopantothenate/pantothenate synthetase [Spirochaetaceae bacterium]|nr:MAG: phosphopantothenate/pantothenate synthetase [Spirochaetaceae bacterium]